MTRLPQGELFFACGLRPRRPFSFFPASLARPRPFPRPALPSPVFSGFPRPSPGARRAAHGARRFLSIFRDPGRKMSRRRKQARRLGFRAASERFGLCRFSRPVDAAPKSGDNRSSGIRMAQPLRSLCAAPAFLFARGSPAGQANAPARPPRRSPSARQRSPTRKEAPQ